ncbi:MAG: cell division protein FtsA [Candidatus Omnitrophota bacterium]
MRRKNIATLNISENFISCAICSLDDKNNISVLALTEVPAKGVGGGVISDLSEAASSVSRAVEKAESIAHTKAISLVASCDGGGIKSYRARGSITIAEKEKEIGPKDIERVTQAAKTIVLPFDREIIHSVIRGFILDGQEGIKDPAGMFAARMEVDMEIVTGLISNLHNLRRAVNMAGFEVERIALSGIAAADAVLEEIERDLGVIFIYICYSSTHIIVYNGGDVKSVDILPVGSGELIELISMDYKIPPDRAEDFLKKQATLEKSSIAEDDKIMLSVNGITRSISKTSVYETIEPRIREFILNLSRTLKDMPFSKEAAAGCVVGGELANLEGFLEMMEMSLNMPVKLGQARRNSSGKSSVENSGELVCLGLAKYWARQCANDKTRRSILGNSPIGKLIGKARDIFSDYF